MAGSMGLVTAVGAKATVQGRFRIVFALLFIYSYLSNFTAVLLLFIWTMSAVPVGRGTPFDNFGPLVVEKRSSQQLDSH